MYEHHLRNHAKLSKCLDTLKGFADMRSRSTMFKFYQTCSKIWVKMDREFVKCRRHQRFTERYKTLETEFNAAIVDFEQWSVIAALTY